MTEELILKPFERLSVSKIDNAEMCLRHYYFQHVAGIEETATDARQKRLDAGNLFDEQVEAYVKGQLKEVSGAVAAVARHYPRPGQSCVDAQRWTRATWAGAPWVGKIDLLTGPSTIWGPLNRPQKNGMIRVTDLKVAGSLKWAKTDEQIDRNRQLHMYATGIYREREKEIPKLFEVSQVVVERNAPHRCQSIVRTSGRDQALELEQEDAALVTSVVACHGEADVMNLPRAEMSQCERWYGDRCPYFERCYGVGHGWYISRGSSLGALMDAEAGKGSAGAGRTIDEIAAGTVPVVQNEKQKEEETEVMLKTPDAASHENAKIEGEDAQYYPSVIQKGKNYAAVQAPRHGIFWEFRILGDDWKILTSDKLMDTSAVSGYRHVQDGTVELQGNTPGAKVDIISLRAIFGPFLAAWDESVAPVVEEKKEELSETSEEDDIFGGASKQVEQQTGTQAPLERRVKELTSVGLTDAQARSLADGGVTLEALRAGTVTVADLTRCKGIGKGGAEKVLNRFGVKASSSSGKEKEEKTVKDESAKDQEKIARITQEQAKDLIEASLNPEREHVESAVAKHAVDRITELEDMVAQFEAKLTLEQQNSARLVSNLRMYANAQADKAPEAFTVFVDCHPSSMTVNTFLGVITPYLARVAKGKNVRDVSMVEPGYLVAGLLNEALHADPPVPCAFAVSSGDYHWNMVRRYFLERAGEVVVASVIV